ncbi:MFS transporter [Streptomyces sp. XY431]|uniref:MFS transporter n=1 Tax=Streptomyces sp. XY431 TaxID=1415562 RepID=UPI0006AEA84A|nr:MFS transporter [Streptomyces sp. XY431]
MPSTVSAPPRGPSARPGYRAVLGAPHAGRTFAAALLGRLSYGVVPLALLLTVREATGSYSAAGAAMALFALASVLLSPVRAGLVDRHGPRRVLPPMAVLYGALLLAVVAATARPGAAPAAVGALVLAAGACTPPLGPVMRTFWRRLLPDPVLLRRAFSLDGVAEELLFVTGPLLVGLLLPVVGPGGAVAVGAGLLLAGALLLVASPVAAGGADGADVPDVAPSPVGRRRRTPLGGGRALRAAVLASGVTGLALGALDLMVLAFAEDRGRPESVGWILAALSAGSAVGGLGLGALDRPVPNAVRLPLFTGGLGLALAAAGLAPGPVLLGVAVGIAGFFVSPALTTSYLVADEAVAPEARTRAGAWVNTAFNAGSAVGGAGVGLLVGHLPLPLCFALAAAPALAAVPVLLRMRMPMRIRMPM